MKNKIFESKHIVRFPDCDPFNHLNNSSYIDYFINAREDHLLKFHNFSIYQTAKETGLSWVVSQNQIAYLHPARLMEKILIDSSIILLTNRQIHVEMKMWNESKTHIKAVLWVVFSHFDLRKQKSAVHNEELETLFRPFETTLETEQNFHQRIAHWRSQNKEMR